MRNQSALEYLTSKVDEQRKIVEEHLVRGNLREFSEYQRLCGVVQGLDFTKQLILDLAKDLENADEQY
tara:strand:+ start:4673 stop:4876 length:204 start_codon:yes stop_codon:yes gene_type:complete